MVQKTGIIVQKKNYTLRTWQTEDAASLAQYLNNKNIWDNCRDGLPYPYSQEDAKVFLAMIQAKENIHDSFDVFMHGDIKKYEKVENREEYVDFLNKEISRYITNAITHEATKAGSQIFNSFYTITSNIERISDHAINIAGYSKMIEEKNISFSDNANNEIDEIKDICDKTMDMLLQKPDNIIKWHENVICMEQKIDDMTVQFRNNMYERIQKGLCTDEGSILFSEMLTDFERVGDHALNISNEMLKITMKEIV